MRKAYVFVLLAPFLLTFAACSTSPMQRGASVPEIGATLGQLHGKYPQAAFSVGNFSKPARKPPACRPAGALVEQLHQTYTGYLRGRLIHRLDLAGMHRESGGIPINLDVRELAFTSTAGTWKIKARASLGARQPFVVSETYHYRQHVGPITGCTMIIQAYKAAVRHFIAKLVASPQFAAALKEHRGR